MAASLKRSENDFAEEKVLYSVTDESLSEDSQVADADDEEKPIHDTKTVSKKKSKKNDDECDKQIEESIDCSICLGSALFPIRIPCGHIFCFLCIKGAARQAKKCPLCRQHVPVDFNKNPVLLKRQGIDTPDDGHQWYYEGKNGWWQYDKITSEEIEENYKLNNKKFDLLICGTMYTIDLERNVQYNKGSPSRRRKLKRESANNIAVKGVAGVH